MKPLLDVVLNRVPNRRPIWLMRQAGRYLPEYREVRSQAGSFLKLCYNPELACEVTLQPLRRFDIDAAILFSDILVVPHALGLALDFKEGEGPIVETVSSVAEVERLLVGDRNEKFEKVWETVGLVKGSLRPEATLIGFCGAPWTVASYMVEGGSSDRKRALRVAQESPDWFEMLLQKVVDASVVYLIGQIKAGAEVVQIFDSWAGDLPEDLLGKIVVDPIRQIVDGVRQAFPNFPVIAFARGVHQHHGMIARGTAANVVGVEEGINLRDVLTQLEPDVAVQGNLAPSLLLGPVAAMKKSIAEVIDGVPVRRHIFNLGHGVTPQVDPMMVERLVSAVRRFDEA